MARTINKGLKSYQAAIKRLFNTPDGHVVLAFWKEAYVNPSLQPDNGNQWIMTYLLGKKEFVQDAINHLKDDGVLDEIKIEE